VLVRPKLRPYIGHSLGIEPLLGRLRFWTTGTSRRLKFSDNQKNRGNLAEPTSLPGELRNTSEDCQRSCEADKACNAFTYKQARNVCFLKGFANQWTSCYPWATTGIKLSPAYQEPKSITPEDLQEQTSPSGD
jgi:PAN domain